MFGVVDVRFLLVHDNRLSSKRVVEGVGVEEHLRGLRVRSRVGNTGADRVTFTFNNVISTRDISSKLM